MKRGKFEAARQNTKRRENPHAGESKPEVNGTEPTAQDKKQGKVKSTENGILMYLHDIVFLVAGIIFLFSVFFRFVIVSGPSMFNTLVDGDFLLLLSSTVYRTPEYGDIVVISKDSFRDGEPIVKRIIATEGQTVDIDFQSGIVYVDGVALEEDYTYTATNTYEGISFPLTVDEGCVFVLGDNRNISKDSRDPEIGLIDTREILGKAIFLLFPGDNKGQLERQFYRIGVFG